jgi:hypothetical protein
MRVPRHIVLNIGMLLGPKISLPFPWSLLHALVLFNYSPWKKTCLNKAMTLLVSIPRTPPICGHILSNTADNIHTNRTNVREG